MKSFVCDTPQSLRDFTDSNYPQGSFCFAALLRGKDIKVNGVRTDKNIPIKYGDEIVYYTTAKQESVKSHTIAYEDENVLIADKFSGVSSEGLCRELNTYGTFYAVHRLDRNTCGLIVYAKTRQAESKLLSAFKGHCIRKTYFAVCRDNFKKQQCTLKAYLKKNQAASLVKIFDSAVENCLEIVTEYSVIDKKDGLALVKINLHTGRTHQIRAHMAHIGCPVLGDNKYGDEALNKYYGLARQCLVAKSLQFFGLSGELEYLNGFTAESSLNLSLQNFTAKK